MKQGNQNIAIVLLTIAACSGYFVGYSRGHAVGRAAAMDAVLSDPVSHQRMAEKDAETIAFLAERNAELQRMVEMLRMDIAKLEAIIRDLRRPVPKNA